MTAVASGERTRYRLEVDRLLGQIAEQARELRLMKVRGARGPALRDQKHELSRARKDLAALTAQAHGPA